VAKYRGPVCRLCRREGEKLFLKGSRCMTEKCAIERRSYPPGQHGQARPRISDYSTQLREKQKLRRIYGLQERQFRGVFERAERQSGVTGDALLRLLECRLDNVAYRLGFGASRKEARQLVGHGHVTVNGRKNNIPGAQVRVGDVVAVRERSRNLVSIQTALESVDGRGIPEWLDLDKAGFKGTVRPGQPGARQQVADLRRGNITIELFQVADAAPLPESRKNPSEDFRTHGVKHFGFEVKNLPGVLAELKAKGVKMAFEMRDNPGTAFAFISDNAGNAIELIEHKTPQ